MSMDFTLEDTQNAAPGLPSMAEQHKLAAAPRKADTQSVTKRFVWHGSATLYHC